MKVEVIKDKVTVTHEYAGTKYSIDIEKEDGELAIYAGPEDENQQRYVIDETGCALAKCPTNGVAIEVGTDPREELAELEARVADLGVVLMKSYDNEGERLKVLYDVITRLFEEKPK